MQARLLISCVLLPSVCSRRLVYQKSYVEFFASPEAFATLLPKIKVCLVRCGGMRGVRRGRTGHHVTVI